MHEIIVIGICLVMNALLAAYEMAFVSAPRPELKKMADSGSKIAGRVLEWRKNPERTLSVIQIGITLVGAISAAVGGAGASESIVPYLRSTFGWTENTAETVSIILVVAPITFTSVVLGELVPKSIALRKPIPISVYGAHPVSIADRVLSPIISLLENSTKAILWLLGLMFGHRKSNEVIEEENLNIEIDSLPPHHQRALLNLAQIEERRIEAILEPWEGVVSVRKSDSMNAIVPVVFASGHTRLPVLDGETVVGVLHTKEFLAFREAGGIEWQTMIRPILKIKASDSILATLRLMQTRRSHMAVAWSKPGTPLGIVTFEDISEEVWGELYDEDEDSRLKRFFADRLRSRFRLR